MSGFTPQAPDWRERTAASFARQQAMVTLGIALGRIEPGEVELLLPYRTELTQQHGYLHAGIVGTALDSACGYAAFSLMPADAAVLTIEYKLNLLAPARGERFALHGRVIKPGRTIIVTEGQAWAHADGDAPRLVATMSATMMTLLDRGIRG